jgi:hypothetical protein
VKPRLIREGEAQQGLVGYVVLPLAETAYRKLGLEDAADLIAHARQLVDAGEHRGDRFDASDIGELFDQFTESRSPWRS